MRMIHFLIEKKDIVNGTVVINFDEMTEDNILEMYDIEANEFLGFCIDPVALSTPIKQIIVISDGKVQSINVFDYDKSNLEEDKIFD